MSYEFSTVDYDIDFQVDFVPTGGKFQKGGEVRKRKRGRKEGGRNLRETKLFFFLFFILFYFLFFYFIFFFYNK